MACLMIVAGLLFIFVGFAIFGVWYLPIMAVMFVVGLALANKQG